MRSEKQLVEQIDYNLLFPRFVGLSLDAEVWDETVFTKCRDCPQGRRADSCWWQWRARLSRREAPQRDARLDHGPEARLYRKGRDSRLNLAICSMF